MKPFFQVHFSCFRYTVSKMRGKSDITYMEKGGKDYGNQYISAP